MRPPHTSESASRLPLAGICASHCDSSLALVTCWCPASSQSIWYDCALAWTETKPREEESTFHSYYVFFFLTCSFWSISFICLYLLHFIASQHLLFLLQLCLLVVQFFRSLGGSTKIYLEDLSVWNASHVAVLIQQWTKYAQSKYD